MSLRELAQNDDFKKVQDHIGKRLDSLTIQLIQCDESGNFRELQGQIKSLVWCRDHALSEMLATEEQEKDSADVSPEESMFGGGDGDDYET